MYCWYRHKGRKAIDRITSDHTICATCNAAIKTIEEPPGDVELEIGPVDHSLRAETIDDVLIGYQYKTEHTDIGVDERGVDAQAIMYTRWSCECGAVDPNDSYEPLRQVTPKHTIKQLTHRLAEYSRQDGDKGSFSYARFKDAFCSEHLESSPNMVWELAAGYALFGN